jgi:peptidoglycan/LPS O-acetylase OafA/YrhL
MKRISEFDALRGLLALWVLVGHVVRHSGYEASDFGRLGFIAAPGVAVNVFIILSGFVIFNLLDQKQEGYAPFIVRRFFRLFPLFFVVVVISASLAGFYEQWLERFPWKTPYIIGIERHARDTAEYLPYQIAAHLTMLHGLIPEWLLPSSQYAIVGPGWSISVEWQFYLLAPLLFVSARNAIAAPSILLAIVFLHSCYLLGDGFAINQAVYFLIGICGYFLFKNAYRLSSATIWLGVSTAVVVVFLLTLPIALLVWAIFLGAAMQAEIGEANPISRVCRLPVAQFLGRVSYSIYLWHILILLLASSAILYLAPAIGQAGHVVFLLALTVLLSLSLSAITFSVIEKPGMAIGQRIADAFSQGRLVRVVT